MLLAAGHCLWLEFYEVVEDLVKADDRTVVSDVLHEAVLYYFYHFLLPLHLGVGPDH